MLHGFLMTHLARKQTHAQITLHILLYIIISNRYYTTYVSLYEMTPLCPLAAPCCRPPIPWLSPRPDLPAWLHCKAWTEAPTAVYTVNKTREPLEWLHDTIWKESHISFSFFREWQGMKGKYCTSSADASNIIGIVMMNSLTVRTAARS